MKPKEVEGVTPAQSVIECRDVKIRFNDAGDEIEILNGIDLDVLRGNFISIVGNSGSGKSTLLHILAGLEQASEGVVRILGQEVARLNRAKRAQLRQSHLGFVYQLHHLLPEFTALENVAVPLMIGGVKRKSALEQAAHWLKQVGLDHRYSHRPSALSGGERQRVAIARALVTSPDCVLADEPTGNLDAHTAAQVQELLFELNSQGTSFIVVTHDTQFASRAPLQFEMIDGALKNRNESLS